MGSTEAEVRRIAAQRDEFEAEKDGAWAESRRNYAAFVGAEAELARLKARLEGLADKFGATPDRSMSHRNIATSIRTALGEDDQ